MNFVTRSSVRAPKILLSPHVNRQLKRAREFYSLKIRSRSQKRLDLSIEPVLGGLTKALARLFHNKCAYCERKLDYPRQIVDHYRPPRSTIGEDGETYLDHYWWLTFDWSNLFLACPDCDKSKGHRFPIQGPRAEILANKRSLADELPILLNPCVDKPDEHLTFDQTGHAVPLTVRGAHTIKLLSLNRSALVSERLTTLRYLNQHAPAMAQGRTAELKDWILRMLAPTKTFLGVRRAWFRLNFASLVSQRKDSKSIKQVMARFGLTTVSYQTEVKPIEISSTATQQQQRIDYFAQSRSIERIEITNFKGIAQLALRSPEAHSDTEFWFSFLGENATGKSSVLQAIALALLGQKGANRMGLSAEQCVRIGTTKGSVRIFLTNTEQPIELQFQRGSRSFRVIPRDPMVLLLGFGATRILPRARHHQLPQNRRLRVKNLFDPFSRLNHAERWLVDRSAVNDDRFNRIAIALKKLLILSDEQQISRDTENVWIRLHQEKIGLSQLSDGYQSILVMAVNIIMGVIDRWKEIEFAEGVVLVDELEVHLHPRWKMEIVNRLRQIFPKMAFITTTHDPLCLRGLLPGEIVVLKRDGDQNIVASVVEESVAHLRADQLLTSPLFGLVSTRDPAVTSEIDRYSDLLGKKPRKPEEESEFRRLAAKLESTLTTTESPVSQAVEKTFDRTLTEIVLPELQQKLAEFEMSPAAANTEARAAVANMLGLVKT